MDAELAPASSSIRSGTRTPSAERVSPLLRVHTAGRTRTAGWDLLMLCLAAFILTSVGRVHQLYPAFAALRPAIITGALAILLVLTDRHRLRQPGLVWTTPVKCMVALGIWMALAVPFALVRGVSFDLLFNTFAKTALIAVVIAAAVRSVADVERLAAVYVGSATVYALIAIARFDVGGTEGRFADLYYYDANDFATFAVTAMPLGLYFVRKAPTTFLRLLSAASLATLALAFVRTGSRGGFVALLAVMAFIVLGYRSIQLRWRVLGTCLVAAVVLLTATDNYWLRMRSITSTTDYNRTDETGRLQIWGRGIGYMLRFPVLGVGPANFESAEGILSQHASRQQVGVGVRWNAAHNSYIQAGAELGIPGLVLFVALIVSTFRTLARVTGRRALAQALTASLLGFVVGAFFLSLAYSALLYTLMAFAVGLRKVTASQGAL